MRILVKIALAVLLLNMGETSPDQYLELFYAVEHNSPLPTGVDINVRNEGGHTVLMIESQGGDAPAVRRLIEAGADVNLKEPHDGYTALMLALRDHRVPDVIDLLIANSDVNVVDNMGRSALQYAVSVSPQAVRAILARGANVNLRARNGQTALIAALRAISPMEIINQLLVASDVSIAGAAGKTALHYAASNPVSEIRREEGVPEIVRSYSPEDLSAIVQAMLDKHAEINRRDRQGKTPLMLALQGHAPMAVVEQLMHADGFDANIVDEYGRTALHYAASDYQVRVPREEGAPQIVDEYSPEDLLAIVRELLVRANVNAQDRDGMTPLMVALENAAPRSVIQALLAAPGVRVDVLDTAHRTALHYAVSGPADNFDERMATIQQLLVAEAPVNQKAIETPSSRGGDTALSMALDSNVYDDEETPEQRIAVINLLLGNGAEVNNVITAGFAHFTFLEVAVKKGIPEIVTALLGHHAPMSERLLAMAPNAEVARILIEHGADVNSQGSRVNSRGSRNASLLIELMQEDVPPIDFVRLLIQRRANVNIQDDAGKTALMYAAKNGKVAAIRELIEGHAEINAQDREGKTALMYAAQDGHVDAVHVLIENHVDINALDHAGRTALMHATLALQDRVVSELLNEHANKELRDSDGRTAFELIPVLPVLASIENRRRDEAIRRLLAPPPPPAVTEPAHITASALAPAEPPASVITAPSAPRASSVPGLTSTTTSIPAPIGPTSGLTVVSGTPLSSSTSPGLPTSASIVSGVGAMTPSGPAPAVVPAASTVSATGASFVPPASSAPEPTSTTTSIPAPIGPTSGPTVAPGAPLSSSTSSVSTTTAPIATSIASGVGAVATSAPVGKTQTAKPVTLVSVKRDFDNQVKKVKKLEGLFKKEQASLKKLSADLKRLASTKNTQQKALKRKDIKPAQKKTAQAQLTRTLKQIDQLKKKQAMLALSINHKKAELTAAMVLKNKLDKQKRALENAAKKKGAKKLK